MMFVSIAQRKFMIFLKSECIKHDKRWTSVRCTLSQNVKKGHAYFIHPSTFVRAGFVLFFYFYLLCTRVTHWQSFNVARARVYDEMLINVGKTLLYGIPTAKVNIIVVNNWERRKKKQRTDYLESLISLDKEIFVRVKMIWDYDGNVRIEPFAMNGRW